MLLTIHNLPPNVTLAGIKKIIQDNCNITQIILDNLSNEGQGKRVTVGLADEGDAALLVRKLNGLYMNGYHIYVEDVRQKKRTEQPYCPTNMPQIAVPEMQIPPFDVPINMALQAPPIMPPGYSSMPFYMSPAQNKYITYNTASPVNPVPPAPFYQQNVPYGYNTNDAQSQWKEQVVTYPVLGPNQTPNVETRQYPSRSQESNWRERRESPSKRERSKDGQGRRDPESFDRSHDKTSRRNEYNRSDYRRDDDLRKGNRYSSAERSPPRERHENRDSRDGKFDNNRRGPNRGEQNRDRYGNNNQNYDSRRPDRDFGRNNQYHNQKRDFGSKRSYAEHSEAHSSTYSNSPNNSTFTNKNANNFGQKSSNFQTGGFNTNYHGPPNKIRHIDHKSHDSSKPPGKMNPPAESVNRKTDVVVIPKDTLQIKIIRHNNWVANAVAQLATAIIKNSGVGIIPNSNEFKKKLKRCILSRINVILHDRITSSLREAIMAYRSKFTVDDDSGFFEAVMEKHKRDLKESGRSYTEEKEHEKRPQPSSSDNKDGIGAKLSQQELCPKPGPKPGLKPGPKPGPKPNAGKGNANNTTQNNAIKQEPNKRSNWEKFCKNKQNPRLDICKPDPSQRLPKFPKGNKQIYKDQKKLEKLEYSEEVYTLDPSLKKALDEETNELCKGFLEACDEHSKLENENIYHLKIKNAAFPKFKKVVELHIKKRLLNISNNLVVRIFSHPKMPKRVALEEFLKQYDVASLKKSEKKRLFLATCASYKSYDELLHLAKAKVGNINIQFKPLNLTGPRLPRNFNKTRKVSNIPPDHIISDDEVEILQEESNMDIEDLDQDEEDNDYDNPDYNEDDEHDGDNINPDDYDTHTDDVIGKCDDANPRLDDSDIVFLETKNDVVVIDDNDKNTNEKSDTMKKSGDAKNSEATDAPNVKSGEANASNVKNSEATNAPNIKSGEATDTSNVKNSEATNAPNVKSSEATDVPIVKNSEATTAPNLNKDDVNKNVVTVNEENKESNVGNNEDNLNKDKGEIFDEGKIDEVPVRDDDLEDF